MMEPKKYKKSTPQNFSMDEGIAMTNYMLEGTNLNISVKKDSGKYEICAQKGKNKPEIFLRNATFDQTAKSLYLLYKGVLSKERYCEEELKILRGY